MAEVGMVLILLVLLAAVVAYFIPTIVAVMRRSAIAPTVLVNLFVGWTMLGWIAALVLAAVSPGEAQRRRDAYLASGMGMYPYGGYPQPTQGYPDPGYGANGLPYGRGY